MIGQKNNDLFGLLLIIFFLKATSGRFFFFPLTNCMPTTQFRSFIQKDLIFMNLKHTNNSKFLKFLTK